jgi:predicted CxxxxCH...CXXCH cytochrome family protein
MNRILVSIVGMISAALLLGACQSKLKDAADLPTNPVLQGVHPAGFIVPASDDFHGKVLTANIEKMSECATCHGADLTGGVAKVSCLSSGCHAHPEGFASHSSPNFHATSIAAQGWDITACAACHGSDFDGGAVKESCNGSGCHVKADGGPGACYTCHGNAQTKKIYPQWYTTHASHLEGGTLAAATLQCSSCHTVPSVWNAPGHLDGANPNGAEVLLSDALASTHTKGTTGIPAYNASTGTCENVYCHGNFTNGNNFSPSWKGTAQGACGSCHGNAATGSPLPKPPHVTVETCSVCHAGVVDVNKQITDKTKHVNGKLMKFGTEVTDW